jgi:hypothetical protein
MCFDSSEAPPQTAKKARICDRRKSLASEQLATYLRRRVLAA